MFHNIAIGLKHRVSDFPDQGAEGSAFEMMTIGLQDLFTGYAQLEISPAVKHLAEREMGERRRKVARTELFAGRKGAFAPFLLPKHENMLKNCTLSRVQSDLTIYAFQFHSITFRLNEK
jgi:hypothetical protein